MKSYSTVMSVTRKLNVHHRIHTVTGEFGLPVMFVTRSSKYIAILGFGIGLRRIHIGEKPFDCHECDKKFKST